MRVEFNLLITVMVINEREKATVYTCVRAGEKIERK